jgi:protease secretion system membrane fusion protein
VQHQSGGTVQEILVKDGDVVKAGQVLVRMNGISPAAAMQTTRPVPERAPPRRAWSPNATALKTVPAELEQRKQPTRAWPEMMSCRASC